MSAQPMVLDVASAEFERRKAPTVIVPVTTDDQAGVLWVTFEGDAEWMDLARQPHNQAELAIACCKLAYLEAAEQGLANGHSAHDGR